MKILLKTLLAVSALLVLGQAQGMDTLSKLVQSVKYKLASQNRRLMYAINEGDITKMQEAIAHSANINAPIAGKTPLNRAIGKMKQSAVQELVKNKVQVSVADLQHAIAKSDCFMASTIAGKMKDIDVTKEALKSGNSDLIYTLKMLECANFYKFTTDDILNLSDKDLSLIIEIEEQAWLTGQIKRLNVLKQAGDEDTLAKMSCASNKLKEYRDKVWKPTAKDKQAAYLKMSLRRQVDQDQVNGHYHYKLPPEIQEKIVHHFINDKK